MEKTTYQHFAQMIFLRDTGRIGTGANQRLYLGNRQSGLLMRLGSLSHLASDLLGLKNRPFERVVHAHSHFPAAKGEYEVPVLLTRTKRAFSSRSSGIFAPLSVAKTLLLLSMPHVSNFTSISNRVSYGRVRR